MDQFHHITRLFLCSRLSTRALLNTTSTAECIQHWPATIPCLVPSPASSLCDQFASFYIVNTVPRGKFRKDKILHKETDNLLALSLPYPALGPNVLPETVLASTSKYLSTAFHRNCLFDTCGIRNESLRQRTNCWRALQGVGYNVMPEVPEKR